MNRRSSSPVKIVNKLNTKNDNNKKFVTKSVEVELKPKNSKVSKLVTISESINDKNKFKIDQINETLPHHEYTEANDTEKKEIEGNKNYNSVKNERETEQEVENDKDKIKYKIENSNENNVGIKLNENKDNQKELKEKAIEENIPIVSDSKTIQEDDKKEKETIPTKIEESQNNSVLKEDQKLNPNPINSDTDNNITKQQTTELIKEKEDLKQEILKNDSNKKLVQRGSTSKLANVNIDAIEEQNTIHKDIIHSKKEDKMSNLSINKE